MTAIDITIDRLTAQLHTARNTTRRAWSAYLDSQPGLTASRAWHEYLDAASTEHAAERDLRTALRATRPLRSDQ